MPDRVWAQLDGCTFICGSLGRTEFRLTLPRLHSHPEEALRADHQNARARLNYTSPLQAPVHLMSANYWPKQITWTTTKSKAGKYSPPTAGRGEM